ncbi:YD repeat protein [Pseudomonas syringae pv. philadelphi]|nr:YD repeat protein [Pseudomonas syringae pv. berberidis]KPY15554.1 YD repeat protein [Pseudomonas syringae pv. philadelphi]RMM26426.1 YD repeat protein [Pseudomonas syringae pv. berberidis]RMP59405.1 YD repeat protein [Pseudomonas syringae pv. berberidis]RMQ38323.1 YD repeat protein [Pseudomonas syringae pv. berberidis]
MHQRNDTVAISDRSVLCVYRYDPLDRLGDCSPAGQGSARFFYQKNRLTTQIQGQIQHTVLRTDEHLLAQRRTENNQSDSELLVTDQQQSVIAAQGLPFAYTPYGHRHPSTGPMNLPGFTGQRLDPVTGHYLLGNGYRAFNPVLMRFNSPDSLSPFGEGGLNAYTYCEGDPVNKVDPSGHILGYLKAPFSASLVAKPRSVIIPPQNGVRSQKKPVAINQSTQAAPSHEGYSKIDVFYAEYRKVSKVLSGAERSIEVMRSKGVYKTLANQLRDEQISKLAGLEMELSGGDPPSYAFAKFYEGMPYVPVRSYGSVTSVRPPPPRPPGPDPDPDRVRHLTGRN